MVAITLGLWVLHLLADYRVKKPLIDQVFTEPGHVVIGLAFYAYAPAFRLQRLPGLTTLT
jgi:hypothetical protein